MPIKIGDGLCLHFKKLLCRYRSTKQVLKQLFKDGNNYEATDEWLHPKLFAENSESLRLMWEYTIMLFLFVSAEDLTCFSRERSKIEELNAFHEKFNMIPMNEEKT